MNPQEQLTADAQSYALSCVFEKDKYSLASGFKAGATSPTAANGCNKHVEIAKIEFAIELLNEISQKPLAANKATLKVYELLTQKEQLETLKQQQ